jgi:hypothetical protein
MTNWHSIERLFPVQAQWWQYAGPGGWNNFDSLIVGNGEINGITEDERRLKASFWAVSAAKWQIGDDMTRIDELGMELLTNREVIAMNQAGRPARPLDNSHEVWFASNGDGTLNLALFNLGSTTREIRVNWADIGIVGGDVSVRDVWALEDLGEYEDGFGVTLRPHAAGLFVLTLAEEGYTTINNDDPFVSYTGDWQLNQAMQVPKGTQNFNLVVIDSSEVDTDGGLANTTTVVTRGVPEDIVITLNAELHSIALGNRVLIEGVDYTLDENTVTVCSSLFDDTIGEQVSLRFIFSNIDTTEEETVMVNSTDPAVAFYLNRRFEFFGGREGYGDYAADILFTNREGSFFDFTFEGTGVDFITTLLPWGSDFYAYINGQPLGRHTTSADERIPQGVGLVIRDLLPGQHTLRVINADGGQLHVDAFDITRADGTVERINATNNVINSFRWDHADWNHNGGRPYGNYQADVHFSYTEGDYLEFTFLGTGVTLITEGNDGTPGFDIYLNGIRHGSGTTDTDGAGREVLQRAYSITGLEFGEHTIRVVNQGSGFLHVDAFEVVRPVGLTQLFTVYLNSATSTFMVNNDDPAIRWFGGGWNNSSGRPYGNYRGDIRWTTASDAALVFTFTGTGVSYLGEGVNNVGEFAVFLNGEYKGTYNAWRDLDGANREAPAVLWEISGLEHQEHVLRLEKRSGQFMLVDAFMVETPSLIMPNAFVFDRANPDNIIVSLESNEGFLLSVTTAGQTLSSGVDYSLSGGNLTFLSTYLRTLPPGTHPHVFSFDGDHMSDIHWTSEVGASASYTFIGNRVELIGPRGPLFGRMAIYINDELVDTIDTYNETRLVRQSLWSLDNIAELTGTEANTIRIVMVDGEMIAIDAILFGGGSLGDQRGVLGDLIDEADRLERENFSAANWRLFLPALVHARNVYDNPDATQAEIEFAINTLRNIVYRAIE